MNKKQTVICDILAANLFIPLVGDWFCSVTIIKVLYPPRFHDDPSIFRPHTTKDVKVTEELLFTAAIPQPFLTLGTKLEVGYHLTRKHICKTCHHAHTCFFCKFFWNRKRLRLRLDAHCVMCTTPHDWHKIRTADESKNVFLHFFADPNRLGQSLLDLCMLHVTCKLTQQLQYLFGCTSRYTNILHPAYQSLQLVSCKLFWNRKHLRIHPDVQYSICAVTCAQLHDWHAYAHNCKCGNVFHPALIPKCFSLSLWHRFCRPRVWPCCLICWNLFKVKFPIVKIRHWSHVCGLIPNRWPSPLVRMPFRFCNFCLRYKRLRIWTDTTPVMSHGMSAPWRKMNVVQTASTGSTPPCCTLLVSSMQIGCLIPKGKHQNVRCLHCTAGTHIACLYMVELVTSFWQIHLFKLLWL